MKFNTRRLFSDIKRALFSQLDSKGRAQLALVAIVRSLSVRTLVPKTNHAWSALG